MLWHQRTLATERSPAIFSCANNSLIGVAIRQGGCPFLFPPVHRLTSIQPVLQCRAMRSSEMYFVLLVLAAVVGGISLDLLRILHRSLLTYFIVVPVWVGVFAVLTMVGRAAFGNRPHSVNRIPQEKADAP